MRRNIETERLVFGGDESIRRSDEFNRWYLDLIRLILWIIRRIPRCCWILIKYLARAFKDIFLRKYIAVIVFFSSVIIFIAVLVALKDEKRAIAIYCVPSFFCSFLSLVSKRGMVAYTRERSKLLDRQQLLQQDNCQNKQEANQPAGYATNGGRQHLQSALENLMEPRPEREADPTTRKKFQVQAGLHRSKSHTPLNCDDESSAGPSHAAEPRSSVNYSYGNSTGLSQASAFNPPIFTITNISDDSYDSDEPFQRFSEARLSVDAVKTFGHPFQVFGADSCRVLLHSTDEDCSSDEPGTSEVKTFEVLVEVHHPDSYMPLNPGNVGSSSAEAASVANDSSSMMIDSYSYSNLSYMDDEML